MRTQGFPTTQKVVSVNFFNGFTGSTSLKMWPGVGSMYIPIPAKEEVSVGPSSPLFYEKIFGKYVRGKVQNVILLIWEGQHTF